MKLGKLKKKQSEQDKVYVNSQTEYLGYQESVGWVDSSPQPWVNGPNGEITKLPEGTQSFKTEIDPNYIHLTCANCEAEFWGYIYQQKVGCPKCHFPLVIKVRYVTE